MEKIEFKKVLYALKEREKWHALYLEFKESLHGMTPSARRERKSELKKIAKHIKYYDGLIREMKFSLSPPTLWNINSLFK